MTDAMSSNTTAPGHADAAKELPRVLGAGSLVMLGIGAIIGTGIWVLTGTAAANQAGPAVIVSFAVAGAVSALAGLCYSELAAMFPVAGSAYAYTSRALGGLTGWFIGWNLLLEYLFAVSSVAVGWGAYVTSFFDSLGISLPHALTSAPLKADSIHGLALSGSIINAPAVFIVVTMAVICFLGVRLSSVLTTLIVAVKIIAILLFIGFGAGLIDSSNWVPFVPENTGTFGEFGWSGVFRGAAIVFFAFVGFDAVSTAAQEARNPQRNMPIGILGSLAVCSLLYMLVATVLTGMAHYTTLDTAAPVASVLDRHPPLAWLAVLVKLGALAGMTSSLLVMLMGQSRITFAMARDGLLPRAMGRLHPRFQTPGVATSVVGFAAAVIAGLLPIQILGEMVSIGTLLVFAVVCASVLLLRSRMPAQARPFRVPAAGLVCPAGFVACVGMMLVLPAATWVRLGIWTLLGVAIYGLMTLRKRAAAARLVVQQGRSAVADDGF